MAVKVSLKELIGAGAHFGHQSRRWNPKMAPYLFGVKEGSHIFDLTKTKGMLEDALGHLEEEARRGKVILLVGTKKQAKEKIREVAQATGSFYINERWLGGIITNFSQVKKSLSKLEDMKKKMSAGEYKVYTKKERLLLEREIARLERFFGGIAGLTQTPDVLIVVDIKKEAGAVREARAKGVEVTAIVDSNCDPTLVDYPIPMNDDASHAVEYVLDLIKEAILQGKKSKGKSKGETKA